MNSSRPIGMLRALCYMPKALDLPCFHKSFRRGWQQILKRDANSKKKRNANSNSPQILFSSVRLAGRQELASMCWQGPWWRHAAWESQVLSTALRAAKLLEGSSCDGQMPQFMNNQLRKREPKLGKGMQETSVSLTGSRSTIRKILGTTNSTLQLISCWRGVEKEGKSREQ